MILITGPSGSGKSQSLPHVCEAIGADPDWLPPHILDDRPILDALPGDPADAARVYSAVGLADAYTWARRRSELSVGQQARLTLAASLATHSGPLVVDEWLANLDRTTARAVAWATGRLLRKQRRSAVLVTAHDDLAADLAPDLEIRVGWSPEPQLLPRSADAHRCTVHDELRYRAGTVRDWHELRHLHYAAGDPATAQSYHAIEHIHDGRLAAVAILSYPDLHSAARNLATDDAYKIQGSRTAAQRLNREVLKLSRIVVAPELRGIGLAASLVQEIAARTNATWLECSTAMGRYSGFLTRIGFHEVPQTAAPVEAELRDWATRARVPATVPLDPAGFNAWLDAQSVRVRRAGRRLVWRFYHHFVLHRRTRSSPPRRIPGPNDPRWPEAFEVVARNLAERPTYYILGPLDPMTGTPSE